MTWWHLLIGLLLIPVFRAGVDVMLAEWSESSGPAVADDTFLPWSSVSHGDGGPGCGPVDRPSPTVAVPTAGTRRVLLSRAGSPISGRGEL